MTDVRMLMKYLELLMKLKDSGYSCDSKINDVIQELHKQMGFDKINTSIKSTGISTVDGVINTTSSEPFCKKENTLDRLVEDITSNLKKNSTNYKDKYKEIFDIHG